MESKPLPISNLLGGLGLFLLGMGLMTETLRVLAGNRLRAALLRFTGSPGQGVLVGAISTALLQSSSATTVATVGFVSSGLLGFEASLGIIFGANVGSTGLGWLVALLGIQLDLGRLMLPMVLVGAAMRLLGRGRIAQVGLAIAGFALLFVGIDMLQGSLAGQGPLLDPANFDAVGVGGRLRLLLLGLLATVITQSSGAGVATMLAALAAGAIQLDQACSVVIGMDVGTTVTALIAAIGGSLSARRTAAAHVGFNLFTAVVAFSLLPAYLALVRGVFPSELRADLPFLLTAFHTGFNLLGVALVLPFTHRFAGVIRTLVRGQRQRPADTLEEAQAGRAPQAIEPAQAALTQTFTDLLDHLLHDLAPERRTSPGRSAEASAAGGASIPLETLQADLDRIELYLDQIHLGALDPRGGAVLVELLHCLDHLQRLHERCEEEADRARTLRRADRLQGEREDLVETLRRLRILAGSDQWTQALSATVALASRIRQRVNAVREDILSSEAAGVLDAEGGTDLMAAIRWLRRVSQHLRQICRHMERARGGAQRGNPSA
jgi:phosphate:Na+ symporter